MSSPSRHTTKCRCAPVVIPVMPTAPMIWPCCTSSPAFRSYLDGLHDAGWAGALGDVRFAYAASVALWAGIAAPVWMRWFTLPARREWLERKFRMNLEDAAEPFGAFIGFALELADEALADARV